jgi:hypothetical protein
MVNGVENSRNNKTFFVTFFSTLSIIEWETISYSDFIRTGNIGGKKK